MPRAYDTRPLVIDRNPLQTLPMDYGKLPKLDPIDPANLVGAYIAYVEQLTGIDLSGVQEFMDWLSDQVGVAMQGFGVVWDMIVDTVQGIIDGIVGVWTGIVDTVDNVLQDAIDAVAGIFGVGKSAALSADNANIGVQTLKAQLAGGGSDEFDYPDANALPSTLYSVSYGGPGAGNYGPNGDGFVVWKPSGASAREVIYRRTDVTLGSDNGVVTVVWSKKPLDPIFSDAYGYICGRMSNVTNNTHIRAVIDNNSVRFHAVVSGTVTTIGSTKTLTIRDGDVFEFFFGTAVEPRKFWLVQNGVTVHTVTDSGAVSQLGADYRQVGFGGYADNYLLLFQNPPPALAGWTWAVQTVSGS